MLTIEKLKKMKHEDIFARGVAENSKDDIYLNDKEGSIWWVAVRGGIHDWAIYFSMNEANDRMNANDRMIAMYGDKIFAEEHIRKLVPCDDGAFGMYRF